VFTKRCKKATGRETSVNDSLEAIIGKDGMLELRESYENKWLKELVLGYNMIEKISETRDKIIIKGQPGYMDPTSKTGRAHFYAPVKKIGNIRIDTHWFNILFIWIGSSGLYLVLYYNLIRRLLEYFENLRLPKPEI
jgi:hypothetical protein